MKKIYIALAVIATALLSSCVKEKSFNGLTPVGENGVAFAFSNVATRSMDALSEVPTQKGISIPVSLGIQDEEFFLDETIEELNPSPATKGAPAYTVNVGTLYTTMGVYADDGGAGNFGGDATFEVMDDAMVENQDGKLGWRYRHNYSSNPWPEDKKAPVDFYLHMPADYPSMGSFDYSQEGSIAFDYSSPRYGADQKDIIFGYTQLSREEHDGYLPQGAPVIMSHALTGIKFRSASDNSGSTKTIITKVEFIGLKGTGHCVITPGTSVVWSGLGNSAYSFSQTFANPDYDPDLGADNVDGTVNYVSGDDNKFGDSWYGAGKDSNNPSNLANLNDDDGSLMFWLVPQTIPTTGAQMKVTFRVKTPDTPEGTIVYSEYSADAPQTKTAVEITHTIDLSDLIGGTEWKAGQLRTYTLNPKDVDVEIFDKMAGYEKKELHVTNTGNTPEYIRMLVIGNWYGWKPRTTATQMKTTAPSILVGYKYAGNEAPEDLDEGDNLNTMQTPWTREETDYGEFDSSFAGGKLAEGREDWVRATTAFYYTQPLGPGEELPSTTPLFKTYTLDSEAIPTIYLPVSDSDVREPAEGVHLIMEVVVQAIAAPKKADGTYVDWLTAWRDATKINIVVK